MEDITREIVTITDEFAAKGSRSLKKMWPSRWTCTRRSISIRLFEHHGVRGAIGFFHYHCTLLHAVVRCLFLSVACLPFGFRQCMLSCGGQRHFVFVFCIFACCADYFGLIGVLC